MPPASQTATTQLAIWMMEEGMVNLGAMVLLGNVPCIRCGHGDSCAISGVKMLHGPEGRRWPRRVRTFGAQQAMLQSARDLGEKSCAAVLAAGTAA